MVIVRQKNELVRHQHMHARGIEQELKECMSVSSLTGLDGVLPICPALKRWAIFGEEQGG